MFGRVIVIAVVALVAAGSAKASAQDADALFARGDFDAAAVAYQAELRAHPKDAGARLGLGAIRLYQNDVRDAAPLLRAAAAADPGNARAARLLAEVERRAAEAARRTEVAGGQTEVPFVTADPLPVVRVVANGKPANFLVDTGGDVDLQPSFAAQIGVKTQSAGSGIFAGGRSAPMQSGMLGSLALGGATAYDVPVHVMETHASQLVPKLKIDGIVGTTYFERYLVTIDYPHNRLVLRPRSASVSAGFEAQAVAAGAAIEPCYLVGDHFVIAQAQVNEAPAGLFLFDSGGAGVGVMPSPQLVTAAGIPLNAAPQSGTGAGGTVTAVPFVAQRVAVGSAVQHNVGGLYTPQGSPFEIFPFTVWGAISNDFLKNYSYTVDFDAMKIVLEPGSAVASTQLSPSQRIFDAAFRRLQSYPVPAYAVWTATWHIAAHPMGFYTGESHSVETYRYAVRLSDGMENVSDPMPSGKLPPAEILPEFLGPFAWTMRSSVRVSPVGENGVDMLPDVAGLKTIATVTAVAQSPYVFDAGAAGDPAIDEVDGRAAYHLRLRPRSDPEKHNLRDLWIDTQTYDLLKAHFVGRYAPTLHDPVSPTDATVYFRNVVGCWVVSRAVWTYQDPPVSFTFDIQSDEIGLPTELPDWLFNAEEYRKHELAGEPDYLGLLLARLRSGVR